MSADDDAPIEEWIAAFRGPLVGLLASWGLDWSAAEEVAQDALATAWVARARFRGDPRDLDALGPWLRGIAYRLSRARARREGVRRTVPLDPALVAPDDAEDPRRALLVEAFAALAPAHQTVLRMHYLEETSARRVAALLGLSTRAVEDRLKQARKALRERVERLARATEVPT
jgi:RNA polymerase sigma factor (sigma-70 family)